MLSQPIYDPARSYYENFEHGPFGAFADGARYVPRSEPKHEFLGHKVWAPFGIPAGPLLNGKYVKAALDKGFDIPVYKTVRTRRYASHPWPNVLAVDVDGDLTAAKNHLVTKAEYGEPLSITNSFGVPSFDPDFWQPDLASAVSYAREGQVVVGSYQGTLPESGGIEAYLADFTLGARLLKETGVKVIEVNLSCPNEGTSNLLCFDVPRARRIVEAIRKELDAQALVIKIAFFEDTAKLKALVGAVSEFVDGISAINTISAQVLDASGAQALPGEGRLWSGICGHSIKWAGLTMTRKLAQIRDELGVRFAIVGVGGVSNAADYQEYRQAGADAVMSATGMMWNPALAQQIKAEIETGNEGQSDE